MEQMNFANRPLHFCVLIPCYNDEPGLVAALKSIRYHTENCLAVIVDDGSKEPLSAQVLKAAVGPQLQLHLIRLQPNSGITIALNTGLHWIVANTSAPYIARLDCNDICDAQRFYSQVDFLNNHPEVGLLGSWCRFQEAGTQNSYPYTTPLVHKEIKKAMHLRNVFIHPTVMFRTELLSKAGYYPENYLHAEDYAFFWKLLKSTKGAIMDQFLVTCAITRSGISYQNRKAQLMSRKKVVIDFSDEVWEKIIGVIKIKILLMVPKRLLLQLKTLKKF
jgi:glycosyltransferase involved in cell wall biosynthesis